MRILLYSRKGGVGKTSVAAATGVNLAKRGYRTLVMSVTGGARGLVGPPRPAFARQCDQRYDGVESQGNKFQNGWL
jgi:hypothetical protein